jgi:hypothetical protein
MGISVIPSQAGLGRLRVVVLRPTPFDASGTLIYKALKKAAVSIVHLRAIESQ